MLPLVSCIMPTADRRRWVPHAVRCFERQEYRNRELVIVDDGEDAIEDLLPEDPRIRYLRVDAGRTLGAKRNLCIEASRGELILHWDDDDWHAPRRIGHEVNALLDAKADVCGLRRMLFHEIRARRTWLYGYPEEETRRWLAGGSLLYTKDFWRSGPFPDLDAGDDTAFVRSHSLDRAAVLDDYEIYVAMIHARNTSLKLAGDEGWTPWHGDLRRVLGDDLDDYQASPRATEILVPTFGQEQYTIRCFDSLLEHTDAYRLVWIDNGSPDASTAAVRPSFERHRDRLFIRCETNLGFVGAMNAGLRAILADASSDADYVVLLNNDTELTPHWLEHLTGALEIHPRIGAAGPMTSPSPIWQAWPNAFALWQETPPHECSGGTAAEISRALEERFGDSVAEAEMLAFFCTAFRRRVFRDVGFLDPRFGVGLGDDDDFCYRLRAAGYALAFAPAAYVVHHHRTTFRALYTDAEIAAMQMENIEKYKAKHGA